MNKSQTLWPDCVEICFNYSNYLGQDQGLLALCINIFCTLFESHLFTFVAEFSLFTVRFVSKKCFQSAFWRSFQRLLRVCRRITAFCLLLLEQIPLLSFIYMKFNLIHLISLINY